MKAESAAKISVSSLVSGWRNVRLKVACAKITANSRKIAMDSATIAGVRLRFLSGRVGGVPGDITCQGLIIPAVWWALRMAVALHCSVAAGFAAGISAALAEVASNPVDKCHTWDPAWHSSAFPIARTGHAFRCRFVRAQVS